MTRSSPTLAVTLELASTPPSMNRNGRSHWRTQAAIKKALEEDLWVLLMASGLPRGLRRVEVSAVCRFPTRRRRDAENHSWMCSKALGDVLQGDSPAGRWIPDDTPEFYRWTGLTFDEAVGPPRTLVHVTAWIADEAAA